MLTSALIPFKCLDTCMISFLKLPSLLGYTYLGLPVSSHMSSGAAFTPFWLPFSGLSPAPLYPYWDIAKIEPNSRWGLTKDLSKDIIICWLFFSLCSPSGFGCHPITLFSYLEIIRHYGACLLSPVLGTCMWTHDTSAGLRFYPCLTLILC